MQYCGTTNTAAFSGYFDSSAQQIAGAFVYLSEANVEHSSVRVASR
jgi:hypothetical protein